GIHLRLRLSQRDLAFEPPNDSHTTLFARLPIRPTRSVICRAKAQRKPNISPPQRWKIGRPRRATGKIEFRRKNTNDRASATIDQNTFSDESRISPEAPPPKRMTDQRDGRSTRCLFFATQGSSQGRAYAECLE